jgi:hypothetical protein
VLVHVGSEGGPVLDGSVGVRILYAYRGKGGRDVKVVEMSGEERKRYR